MINALVKIPGYQVSEEIYNGSRTLVYRGYREIDQKPVVIKLLKNFYPSFSELLSFRNQYTIAKNLNSPLIIQTYSLEPYQNSYVLVMEDFGGISLKDYFTSVEALKITFLQEFLEIAIALCNALDILYRNCTIHKDIKPSNILINPETKQVKLIDFSIASLLPRETQEIQNANTLEGTLAYLSPEQTGRMNRGIDYRSDFYSLGVTFYELLTGQLPFISDDPMELVHCHLAKTPILIHYIIPEIPLILAEIISKLMAKNAEDRYQSALGIKHDLMICLHQLQATGNIISFKLGERDISDRFLIPEKLYGREQEVKELLAAFERVSSGNSEMVLVAGFSGIGKTAVVNEIHKPIVKQRGYFIKGKFDQFNRNIPFSAFVQAFRDLMGQMLTESDAKIQLWKSKILEAVGENGQVIVEVIPELERIIGTQEPAPELSGSAAQNRFNLLFQKFTQVLTTKEHPLVIFLDDLQWADSASLKLMQLLMADTEHLFLIGAYRDNEIFPAHPLMLTLNAIQKTAATINTITLEPLSQFEVNELVADTLKYKERLILNLSQLVYHKTQGNPFFTTQFLKALHQDELIKFDFELGCWQCDIAQVTQQMLTSDVVEFMALQLQKLPESTQEILKLAACIGNQFDLATLAIVSEKSEIATATDLWTALQEGLILPQSDIYKYYQGEDKQQLRLENDPSKLLAKYKFLHDRVQQAAYFLIPDAQKQSTHLKIGQLLLGNASAAEREEQIFALVNQLNIGRSLITQVAEREQLLQLNLTAAQKAKISTAYSAATQYLEICIELLPEDSWQSQTDLTRTIYELATEVAYLGTNYEQMEQLAAIFLSHTDSLIEKIRVYEIKMLGAKAQGQLQESIQIGLQLLKLLGVEFPEQPTPADIGQALEQTLVAWKNCSIPSLLDLPVMTDPVTLAAMRILTQMIAPAYQSAPILMPLLIFKQINLCIAKGNCEISAFSYADYGLVLCGIVGDLDAGYQFGQLALNILSRFQAKTCKCRTYFIVHSYISHWKESLRSRLPFFLEGYQVGLETGDLESSSLNAQTYCASAYFAGYELPTLAAEMEIYRQGILQLKQEIALNYQGIYYQTVLNLLGASTEPWHLDGEVYAETQTLPTLQQSHNRTALYYLYYNKTVISYLFGEYQRAADYTTLVDYYADSIVGMFAIPLFCFYSSLLDLKLYSSITETEQAKLLEKVAVNQEKLKRWANHAPMNHLHKFSLVEAERHRVLGEKIEAIEMYDRAIALAKANEYIQEEALANELAAQFYLDWGKQKVAAGYMQEAYYCYAHWGAKAKTDDLEKRYPQLLQPILQQQPINLRNDETIAFRATSSFTRTNSTSISDALDFTSILKAAQAISSSIELDEIIANLTQIILENSGAKKAILILPQKGNWQVRAIISINYQPNSPDQTQTILAQQSLDTYQDIPIKIINYVKNTKETVVIDNCQTDIPGIIGEYMVEHQPKSVLCTPIINQRHLVGILYLENQITSGVFTNERLQVINLLSSQAAISLENARLYQKSQQALQDLQQAQLQIVQSEKMSVLGNLVAGVAHEMNNPLGFIYASLKQAKPTIADIVKHLKIYQESLPNKSEEILQHAEEIDLDYSLEDLPKMLDSMTMACDRLNNISTSLRTFSRADKDYKVPFNIHEGIDSTILILKHRLKANEQRPAIEVISNYSNLPEIECFPGQLNQVFMNILANAIDALEESNYGSSFEEIQANPNKIIITTSVEYNQVKISIADNGKGMSEEVKSKIFNHLFTTKAVGKGTGLGLAIARQIIVEKHGGSLSVNSTLGQGTEFTILLPVNGSAD
ncbi:ATP-binding sensor histidine kinase [Calothrix sp. PCC 7507]|uniref:ATP-binding sensor histidine kinase n=1 Tax=Calothrix sp. PCC 7507 TaxID=99598 RepID=UPI00029F40DA|nr:ATP-binding sensor histidine kinase [Calothrix sp. PCC 7507]AFY33684.1 multi-sensor signal transduction multi-kinase [Calothrix sp. PCC 7507]